MAEAQKDTIYIDVDDEITAVIEKVRASKHRIVALVLPKRATVLHSIVNMKLLKRSSDEIKKHVVLISSDTVMMPIAGAVGMYVAKTLQTKPEIPSPPDHPSDVSGAEEAEVVEDTELDKEKTVGELAGIDDEEETIELDDEAAVAATGAKAGKKAKKIKIPNFNKFRTKTMLAVGILLLLIIGWYVAYFVMPRATVVIKTDTQSITSSLTPMISAVATELDEEKLIVPAVVKELKKTDTEKSPATGQKDIGEKATGKISIKNCEDTSPRNLPAGTTFTSGNKSFVADAAVTVPAGQFSGGGSVCNSSNATFDVTASAGGDSYNLAATTYTSNSSALSGKFTITGTAMAGGTTNIVKVVSQNDIDSAKQRLANKTSEGVADELAGTFLQEGLYGLTDSLETGTPEVKNTPAVNEQADEVTVTSTTTYKMAGVKAEYIRKLIENDVKKQIDTSKQSILNDGFDDAVLRIFDKKATGEFTLSLQVAALTGPEINPDEVKQEIAGKKRAEAQSLIQKRPGVTEVTIRYSPFWVYTTPKQTAKISIQFEDSNPQGDANTQ